MHVIILKKTFTNTKAKMSATSACNGVNTRISASYWKFHFFLSYRSIHNSFRSSLSYTQGSSCRMFCLLQCDFYNPLAFYPRSMDPRLRKTDDELTMNKSSSREANRISHCTFFSCLQQQLYKHKICYNVRTFFDCSFL